MRGYGRGGGDHHLTQAGGGGFEAGFWAFWFDYILFVPVDLHPT